MTGFKPSASKATTTNGATTNAPKWESSRNLITWSLLGFQIFVFLKGPFPDSFFFISVFSKQLVVNRIPKLLDSKCASLVSERTALPPEPQPQPVARRFLWQTNFVKWAIPGHFIILKTLSRQDSKSTLILFSTLPTTKRFYPTCRGPPVATATRPMSRTGLNSPLMSIVTWDQKCKTFFAITDGSTSNGQILLQTSLHLNKFESGPNLSSTKLCEAHF